MHIQECQNDAVFQESRSKNTPMEILGSNFLGDATEKLILSVKLVNPGVSQHMT